MQFSLVSKPKAGTKAATRRAIRKPAPDQRSLLTIGGPNYAPHLIQPKLKVSEPNDKFEREADRMADVVMHRGVQFDQDFKNHGSEELPILQTKKRDRASKESPAIEQISAHGNTGQPLPQSLKTFFEPSFGHDFSHVRLHPDGRAADRVDARAFTMGHDIHFGSGQYAPTTNAGKWLLAHELTHVIQQERALPYEGVIQRKDEGSRIPTFKDCTTTTTLSSAPNKELELARDRASDYADVAISMLTRDPARYKKDATYPVALRRHFLSPTDTDRTSIRANYLKIRELLKPEKIRCVAAQTDRDYCDKDPDASQMAAFARGGETFLCQSFWSQFQTCRAITLIHEAAHHLGIGSGTTHPPYRGSTEYPSGSKAAGSGETTALRMANPDAYAYFAAHVWRDTDTECHVFVGIPETIEMTGKAPGP
jgi:hypothetical protein